MTQRMTSGIFARRMKLPEDQMKPIRAHWEAGRPLVGIRTASHRVHNGGRIVYTSLGVPKTSRTTTSATC